MRAAADFENGADPQASLEYSALDRCVFTTSQERSLQAIYGEGPDQDDVYEQQLRLASTRLVTLLGALKVLHSKKTPKTAEPYLPPHSSAFVQVVCRAQRLLEAVSKAAASAKPHGNGCAA